MNQFVWHLQYSKTGKQHEGGGGELLSKTSINAQFHFYSLQETQHPLVLLQQYFSICRKNT